MSQKLPTAKMIGPGTRVAVYCDPITRKKLIGMATIRTVRSMKTVWIDAAPMLEVFVDAVLDTGEPPRGDGITFKKAADAELFSVYLKP